MRQLAIDLVRISAGSRHQLRGEQVHHDAVLVGRPHGAVASQERQARALLATEAERAVEEPGTNHLKPTGTSTSVRPSLPATRSIKLLVTTVFPTAAAAPARPMREEIGDRGRQVVIRIHQAGASRHDAVPVGVGIVAERDVEALAEAISVAMA